MTDGLVNGARVEVIHIVTVASRKVKTILVNPLTPIDVDLRSCTRGCSTIDVYLRFVVMETLNARLQTSSKDREALLK